MQHLGQHFLKIPSLAKKIVAACEPEDSDEILEIGPGHGELTQHYIGKTAQAYLIEMDPGLCLALKKKWGRRDNIKIIQADFRKFDLKTPPFKDSPIILSDLPYYASKPILAKILNWGKYKRAILMLQKELASRILAQAGDSDFGALSLFFQMKARGEILFDVGPENFYPKPRVVSSVIKIEPKKFEGAVQEKENLEKLIRLAFAQRRKTLLNNITPLVGSKTKAEETLHEIGLNSTVRPQEISLATYAVLSKKLLV